MKKISQYVLYFVLGVLVVGFVLTAVLKKNFAPNINLPAYSAGGITISKANDAKYDGLTDEEDYNLFISKYNQSYELTILYSLFSGKISREQKIERYGTTAPSLNTGYIITFNYAEGQVLKANNKVFYEGTNSTTEILYKKVVFNIDEGRGLTNKVIYFYVDSTNTYYKLTTLANYDELYKFVSELSAFAEQE